METGFAGKVALVTGAASGIGRATAVAFAQAGVRAVTLADVSEGGLEDTAAMVRAHGAEALLIRTDVSSKPDVEQMVARTIAAFGRLDYAFNNAGVESGMAATADITDEDWQRIISINLTGVWLCMRAEIPALLNAGGGAIVNCASVAGLVGFQGAAAYVASKHGVVGLTKSAALDYAQQNIRVNAVCPGVIRTPTVERVIAGNPAMEDALAAMEPIGRMGKPEEVASLVLWLCSDGASFMTGEAIAVDGGFVAR